MLYYYSRLTSGYTQRRKKMLEKTFVRGERSATIRLEDEYLGEFIVIMRELTRYGTETYNGGDDFWTTEGWADIEGDDNELVEEDKFYIVKVSWSETFCRKRPKCEWTVGGSKFTKNVSTETEISTNQTVINAVKAAAGLVFSEVEIVETDGPCDPSKWEEI